MAGKGGCVIAEKPSVETAQEPFELAQLLAVFDRLNPARILEVGVWHGGTLWHWLQGGRIVVAVDDTMLEADDWRAWADEAGSDLILVQGDSRSVEVMEAVDDHGPFDFIHIDADHTYEAVKSDWETFGPMVANGGVVALHDINERAGYGVSQLWAELKRAFRYVEINGGIPSYCGIGLLWL